MATEIDFPRGGTPKVLLRTTQQSYSADHNYEEEDISKLGRSGHKRRNTKPSMSDKTKKIKLDEGEATNEYAGVFRQSVSPELLAQNVRGLAFVKFIGELEVTLECIGGIQLTLPADKVSRIFTEQMAQTKATLENLFNKGQALAFKVSPAAAGSSVKKEKRKKPQLHITSCPYEVNSHLIPSSLLAGTTLNGCISSIEEKGAIIDLGFSTSSAKGFVASNDLPSYLQLDKLHIGQVAIFRVKERPTSDTRVIRLTGFVEMDTVDEVGSHLEGKPLMPGTMVQVQPEKVVFDGIFVGIKNGPKAYIRKVHLPPRLQYDPSKLPKSFRACVLCSQPNSPLIILTAHPDTIALSKIEKRILPNDLKIGSRINGTIYHVDKKQNVYFKLDDETYQQTITAKCLRLYIDDLEANLPRFTIGSEHLCRIIGYSSVERLLFVSTRTSDLNKTIISAEEAKPGTKLKGTVKVIRPNGMIVELGEELTGFLSTMHALDKPDKQWQKRFHINQPIWCRVLFSNSNSISNRLILTAKPSMVKKSSNEKLIDAFDKQFEGAVATGVVIKHLEGGSVLIAFFNRVAGILAQSIASHLPAESIQIGASIKVHVRSVNPDIGQMALELNDDNFGELKIPTKPVNKIKAIGMEKTPRDQKGLTEKTKTIKHAKPFQIYTAKVVGPWPYGGTAAETTAELLLPGETVGRLHVSELNNLHEFTETSRPMQEFLKQNSGKMINVKVICVSKNKAFPKPGRELLMEMRKIDRVVECTARQDKLQDNRKKLTLMNYRNDFDTGDLVPVFIVPSSSSSNLKGLFGEVNPDFHAFIPHDKIKIDPILERMDELAKQESAMQITVEDLFDNGEMRFGRVISVNTTRRGKLINLELVQGTGNEHNIPLFEQSKRERKRTLSKSEEEASQIEQSEIKEKANGTDAIHQEEDEAELPSLAEEDESEEITSGIVDTELEGEQLNSPEEYETMILSNKNSIPLWIGFIQFYLLRSKSSSRKRYECGKNIAERALKTIIIQNDSDLANLWKVYLNLEVLLGTEESLNDCFKRACASSKSMEMHKYLIKLLKEQPNAEGREEEVRAYYNSMINKFRRTDLEPWFAYAKHLLEGGDAQETHKLLRRAFQCMDKKRHLTLLSRFTQLEERYGDKERAKTMQELMKNYKEEGKKEVDIQYLERALGGGSNF